jgi:hypothetical protein
VVINVWSMRPPSTLPCRGSRAGAVPMTRLFRWTGRLHKSHVTITKVRAALSTEAACAIGACGNSENLRHTSRRVRELHPLSYRSLGIHPHSAAASGSGNEFPISLPKAGGGV